jgi:hypothetical protein
MPTFRRNRAYTIIRKYRIRPPGLRGRRRETRGGMSEILGFRLPAWLLRMSLELARIRGYKLQDRLRAILLQDLAIAMGITVEELQELGPNMGNA